MGIAIDLVLIDYFYPRLLGIRILVHNRVIGRVTLPTVPAVILSHHYDVLVPFRKVSEGEGGLSVKVRSCLERSKGMGLDNLGIFAK